MTHKLLIVGVAALLGASACAGTRSGASSRNLNVISAAELEQHRQAGVRDLYELIDRIRPRWLAIRSDRSLQLETIVLVYQNNSRLGGIDALRGYLLTPMITSIRYLDAAQAGLLPGAGSAHVEGAIVIVTDAGGAGTERR
jgi:hypothetical protein